MLLLTLHFQYIIIWNDINTSPNKENYEAVDMHGVPVHVIKVSENTLINRFRPWDIIETEGVLIIDDDIRQLTPAQFEWGFR